MTKLEQLIKDQRTTRFRQYLSVAELVRDPRVERAAKEIADIWRQSRPVICTSFHLGDYLSFFLVTKHLPVTVYAFMDERVAELSSKYRWLIPNNVKMCSAITIEIMRDLKRGRGIMFVMADILMPKQGSHIVEVFGKFGMYTTSWADLAVRLDSEVLLVLSPFLTGQPYKISLLQKCGQDAFGYVESAFDIFEFYVGDAPELWENYPLHLQRDASINIEAAQSRHQLIKSLGGLLTFDLKFISLMRTLNEE